MSRSINVTPQYLSRIAGEVEGNVNDYVSLYRQLNNEVTSLSSRWKGEGNQAYATQIKGFEPEFDKLKKVLLNYVQFLREAAKIYSQTENNIKDGARKLATGR